MSSTRHLGRKLKRPIISAINEESAETGESQDQGQREGEREPGRLSSLSSNDSGNRNRIFNPRQQLFNGAQAEYEESDPNISISRTHSNPVPHSTLRYNGLDRGDRPPDMETTSLNSVDKYTSPRRRQMRNNSAPNYMSVERPNDPSGLTSRPDPAHLETQQGILDWPGQSPVDGRSRNDNYSSSQQYDYPRPSPQHSTSNWRNFNTQPADTGDGGPVFSSPRDSMADASASYEYDHRLAGSWNDFNRGQHHMRSNKAAYFQEPSPEVSISSRTNSIASSDSRYSAEVARAACSPPTPPTYHTNHTDGPLDIRYLSQETERAKHNYEKFVLIWQDDVETYATMKFDTQCRDSNWVSERLVEKLRARLYRMSRPVEFQAFNGQLMTATQKTVLSFASPGGVSREATFFVAANEYPFEVLLGGDDCQRLNIIRAPVLGLLAKKQTQQEREDAAIREAQFQAELEEKEERRKERARREKEKAMREKEKAKESKRRRW